MSTHTLLLVFYALAQFFAHSYVEVKTRTLVYKSLPVRAAACIHALLRSLAQAHL